MFSNGGIIILFIENLAVLKCGDYFCSVDYLTCVGNWSIVAGICRHRFPIPGVQNFARGIFSERVQNKPSLDYNYFFLINLGANLIPFGAESIGKW